MTEIKEQAISLIRRIPDKNMTYVLAILKNIEALTMQEANWEDPFYSEENQAQIRKADAQVRAGHVVVKSMEELEAMAGE